MGQINYSFSKKIIRIKLDKDATFLYASSAKQIATHI